jgi:DNA-binding transcriptional ArsR family regulator
MSTRGKAADHDLAELTELFGLLSDRTRLSILLLLAQGERNVSSLCKQLQVPQPTVSHHLSLMRTNNVIVSRRNGKQVFYALNRAAERGQDGSVQLEAGHFNVEIGGVLDEAQPSRISDARSGGASAAR